MADIVLFHSALGLRPGVHQFADQLRRAGHTVHTPDLYEGRVFDELTDGVSCRDGIGFPELIARATAAVEPLPDRLVYAGFSMGCAPAQMFTQTRPGAAGALLFHGALPSATFETPWPPSTPLAIHTMEHDEWVDMTDARLLADEARAELFLYPGSGHLFADPDLAEYDEKAADLLMTRTLDFLSRLP